MEKISKESVNHKYKFIAYSVNIILYLVTIGLWIAIPDEFVISLIVTTVSIVTTIILVIWDRKRLQVFYLSSQFKNFSDAFFIGGLVFIIIGFLNYFGFKHPIHFDMSIFKSHSLSDLSIKSARGVKDSVKIQVFAKQKMIPAIKKLLDLYVFENSKIDVKYIDEELRPDLISKYNIQNSNSLHFQMGNRIKIVSQLDELHVTNALIQLNRKDNPTIAFVKGHGEADLADKSNNGFSYLSDLIKNSNFNLQQLSLMNLKAIPKALNILVIWGPKEAFVAKEIKMIEEYLERGGNLVIALNPNLNGDKFQNLRAVLEKRGLYLGNNIVIDRLKNINGSNGTVPMVDQFSGKSPIIKNFKGPVFFPLVSSVQFSRSATIKGKFEALAQTLPFPASWAEHNIDEFVAGKITYTDSQDIRGPLTLAASFETEKEGAKILIFGNSNFIANSYKKFAGNFKLFLNALSWNSGELKLVSLNMPILKDEPVFISRPQLGTIFYFSVIFAPLILFAMAFVTYRRRSFL